MNKKSEIEPADQALMSRLERLEAKVAELSGLIAGLTQKASSARETEGGIAPHLLAVIAAAIDTVIKVPHLIHSIHEVEHGKSTFDSHDWSVEGRREIFSSHHVR